MENGPILKKVRRPINRSIPVSSSEPAKNTEQAPAVSNANKINSDTASKDISLPSDTPVVSQLPVIEKDAPKYNENYYDNQRYGEEYFDDDISENSKGINISVKIFVLVLAISLLAGLFMGRFLFGGQQVTQNGLQGVVINSEVPRGRARCGVADRNQGCVIYIMNSQRQNMRAKDFYDLAAQMTGRQKFMIETGNMRYANVEIRPGDIAQINIPPL